MAKVIQSVCDKHLHEGVENVGGDLEKKITIDGVEYMLDLCKEDHDDWFAPFADLIQEVGIRIGGRRVSTKPGPRADERGEHICPVDTCDRHYGYSSSLRKHLSVEHADYLEVVAPQAAPKECDIDGCDRTPRGFRGLVQHIRQGHPDEWPAWAKENTRRHDQD